MIATLIKVVSKWNNERLAIAALARLSDERLHDIGLERGNLAQAIRQGLKG